MSLPFSGLKFSRYLGRRFTATCGLCSSVKSGLVTLFGALLGSADFFSANSHFRY
jgi:hypothetical protein